MGWKRKQRGCEKKSGDGRPRGEGGLEGCKDKKFDVISDKREALAVIGLFVRLHGSAGKKKPFFLEEKETSKVDCF